MSIYKGFAPLYFVSKRLKQINNFYAVPEINISKQVQNNV